VRSPKKGPVGDVLAAEGCEETTGAPCEVSQAASKAPPGAESQSKDADRILRSAAIDAEGPEQVRIAWCWQH